MAKKIKSVITVVIGPLAAGKSTYCRKLAQERGKSYSGVEMIPELDTSEPDCWNEVLEYAEWKNVNVIETHIDYGREESIDDHEGRGFPWKIPKPPENLKFVAILPEPKELIRRYKTRDSYYEMEDAVNDLSWYSDIAKQLGAKIVK